MEKIISIENIILKFLEEFEINNIQWECIKNYIDTKYSIEKNNCILKK